MATTRVTEWRKLPVSLAELCVNTSLRCGQSFRWRQSEENECIPQAPPTPPSSAPSSVAPFPEEDDTPDLVRHYFNLDTNLKELYGRWSAADRNFEKKAPKFTGVRILRQDAWEALVGFICSSNNNIARISQMVEKLCNHYGPLIGHVGSQPFHDLPSPSALTDPKVESHLRQLGFGYRARYIHQTAVMIAEERPMGWLESLRNPENPLIGRKISSAGVMEAGGRVGYREAHEHLLELQGVGPKVADCVCLMGLGWGEAVPVDTHVWQIAQRDYKFGKGRHKSLTKATYDAVGDHFRSLWGKEAGWAHSVLFTADLRAFSERLKAKVEIKEESVVKMEDGAEVEVKRTLKVEEIVAPPVKREAEDEEGVMQIEASARAQRAKRRRWD